MHVSTPRWPARALGAGHLGWGIACLVRPQAIAGLAGVPARTAGRRFVQVLGARHVATGLALVALPARLTARLTAGVDATHALSMVGLALEDGSERTPALLNAAAAGGWWVAARAVSKGMD